MRLLVSQKNELFDIIEQFGLSPNLFNLEEYKGLDQDETVIVYKKTDFEFRVTLINGGWYLRVAPAEFRYSVNFAVSSWSEVTRYFSQWVTILLREIRQINKWERLADEVNQINMAYSEESDKFTASEYEDLKIKMLSFKSRLNEIDLLPDQIKALENKIDHLTDLAVNLGKFDWKNLFVGTIISVIIQLGVNQQNAKALWDLIRKIFNTYFLP